MKYINEKLKEGYTIDIEQTEFEGRTCILAVMFDKSGNAVECGGGLTIEDAIGSLDADLGVPEHPLTESTQ